MRETFFLLCRENKSICITLLKNPDINGLYGMTIVTVMFLRGKYLCRNIGNGKWSKIEGFYFSKIKFISKIKLF